MSIDKTTLASQNVDDERITAENMALLCSKNIKLDIAPILIPDIAIAQVELIVCRRT